ncbi:MAG: nuclease domain-containing protein, partial [Rhodothermales bacterium]
AEAAGRREPLRSLIAVERRGLHLRLRKGHAQTVTFPLSERRRLDLTYNPRFGGRGYLVPQQPDLLLTLRHADGAVARYVLDAKYRLDASPSYRKRYGLPGPPTDALNDLHRYRDAIQDRRPRHPGERAVVQAVALYPYREEEPGLFEKSRHRRMIDEIGVGAIPLLPGETAHLAAWLTEVLEAG